ncbi:MAG: hypothetical protein COA88_12880 [Kordia sp.]|nr:MAG: hypothetical protein COA88_12880 [Kordia sp.]
MGIINRFFTVFLVLFFSTNIFSQEKIIPKSNWGITLENEKLLINQRVIVVNDKHNGIYREYIQYQYHNKTEKQLFIKWYFVAEYLNQQSKSKLDDENYRALLLEPKETFLPKFNSSKDKMFFVFKKLLDFNDKPTLESVNFHNLEYKTL